MANTVLLKAREGTASPRSHPGPRSRPGPRSHAASRFPSPRTLSAPPPPPPPRGHPRLGSPHAPPHRHPGTPPSGVVGAWVGLARLASPSPPGGDGCPAAVPGAAGRVRLSVPPCGPRDAGQRIEKAIEVPFPQAVACAENTPGRPRAALVRPSVCPCQRDVSGVDGARASKTFAGARTARCRPERNGRCQEKHGLAGAPAESGWCWRRRPGLSSARSRGEAWGGKRLRATAPLQKRGLARAPGGTRAPLFAFGFLWKAGALVAKPL